jgi:hypothetical protein
MSCKQKQLSTGCCDEAFFQQLSQFLHETVIGAERNGRDTFSDPALAP